MDLAKRYDTKLLTVSVLVIVAMVSSLTLSPEWGKQTAFQAFQFMSLTFGSLMQIIGLSSFLLLIIISFSKYGNIRLGKESPKYSTLSWAAMMFFAGNGAGTLYWVFLEWGYHFNAQLQTNGISPNEAINYEKSLAYAIFDWGPNMWAISGLFILPFAYHYHLKKDDRLKLSQICKYAIGEKYANGIIGKVIDFLFIFATVGAMTITAGTSSSAISITLADFLNINPSFMLLSSILLLTSLLYTLSSILGIEKGMRRISDWNIYISVALLFFIFIAGPSQFIFDSLVNSIGIVANDFFRMSLWTDPILKSGYPQNWTGFYLVYFFIFGPFVGMFCAKISQGRTVKEVLIAFIIFCSLGTTIFFAVVGGYQQSIRISGGLLDVPLLLTKGEASNIASLTLQSLPFSYIPTILYILALILFLATTLDACSFTLSAVVTRNLSSSVEPSRGIKTFWCFLLLALPLALNYAEADIDTIKSIVLLTGLPLVALSFIVYKGLITEIRKEFGKLSAQEIIRKTHP